MYMRIFLILLNDFFLINIIIYYFSYERKSIYLRKQPIGIELVFIRQKQLLYKSNGIHEQYSYQFHTDHNNGNTRKKTYSFRYKFTNIDKNNF